MELSPLELPISDLTELGSSGQLRLLALSDLHLPKGADDVILSNRYFLDSMDAVVFLGDMVAAYGTDPEYEKVRQFVKNLMRPHLTVSGNHEWYFYLATEASGEYGKIWRAGKPEQRTGQIKKFMHFWRLPQRWYSRRHKLGRFVFLSIDVVNAEHPEGLSEPQLEFLRQEVIEARDQPLFVFCHAPLSLGKPLDLVYYEAHRAGCVQLQGELCELLTARQAASFWMSGHVHLHPRHHLFSPYRSGGNVWQIHCPDSLGYGRWKRGQDLPEAYEGLYGRYLAIDDQGVSFVTRDYRALRDIREYRVDYS